MSSSVFKALVDKMDKVASATLQNSVNMELADKVASNSSNRATLAAKLNKEERERLAQAKHDYIYSDEDRDSFEYQTVGEYDQLIAKLEEERKKAGYNYVYDYRGPSSRINKEQADAADLLSREIGYLKNQRNILERTILAKEKYGNLRNAADYKQKSIAKALEYTGIEGLTKYGGETEAEQIYKFINDPDEKRKEKATIDYTGRDSLKEKMSEYFYLTPDEIADYNYLFNTRGIDAAQQYLDDVTPILKRRYTRAREWSDQELYDSAGLLGKIGLNALTVVAKPMGALQSLGEDVKGAVTGEYSPYGAAHAIRDSVNSIRGATAKDIQESTGNEVVGDLFANMYQAGMSAADMLVGAYVMGPTAYLATAGAEAATNKAKQLYESGADGWQIGLGAVMSGGLEMLIEKLPLENLAKMAKTPMRFKTFLINAAKQAGVECTEEMATEMANLMADAIIQGGRSDHSQAIYEYQKQGCSAQEAEKRAFFDRVIDIAWAGFGGLFSGGLSASSVGAANYIKSYQQTTDVGRQVAQDPAKLKQTLEAGLATPKVTVAHKLAASLQSGKVTDHKVGALVQQLQSKETARAVELSNQARQSAQHFNVDPDTVDTVAEIAAATGRSIVFGETAPENGAETAGQFDPSTGVVTINPAVSGEAVVSFVVKHELTHSVQDTRQWNKLAQFARAKMGETAWKDTVAQLAESRGLSPEQAQREAVADWVGDNLFSQDFVSTIVKGDAAMGNAFLRTIDRLRLALGNKKSRTNTNLAVVERLFVRALQQEQTLHEGEVEYSVEYLSQRPNKSILDLLKKVVSGNYRQNETISLGMVSPNVANRIQKITGIDVTGWEIVVEARQLKHILKRHGKNGAADRSMANDDDIAKMGYILNNAEHIVDGGSSKAYTNFENGKDRPAKTVLYQKNIGEKFYYVVQAVPNTKRRKLFVDSAFINKTKKVEDSHSTNALNLGETSKNESAVSSTNTNVSQNTSGVNTQSMQIEGENTQHAVVDPAGRRRGTAGENNVPTSSDDRMDAWYEDTKGNILAAPHSGSQAIAESFDAYIQGVKQEAGKVEPRDILHYVKRHPELDFIRRIAGKDRAVTAELIAFLNGIDDVNLLESLSWHIGTAYYDGAAVRESYGYGPDYGESVRTFRKAVRSRINEIVAANVEGTNLGVVDGEVSLANVRDLFYRLNSNEELRVFAEKVFATAERLGVNIRFTEQTMMRHVVGDSLGDMVEYKTSYLNDTSKSDQHKASTLLHELIHSCTAYAMNTHNAQTITDGNVKRAVEGLTKIYEELKNDKTVGYHYGLENPMEMVAELSNVEFVDVLKKKNLWNRVLDFICDLFGFTRGTNAYANARACVDYILDTPDATAYKGYAQESRNEAVQGGYDVFGKVDGENDRAKKSPYQDEKPLALRSKTHYNEFRSLAMQWAHSNKTHSGDSAVFYDGRRRKHVLVEAMEDGYFEVAAGTYGEMSDLYERAHRGTDNEIHADSNETRTQQGRGLWDMQFSQNRGNDDRDAGSTGSQGLQTDAAGNHEYLRSRHQGEPVNRARTPMAVEQYYSQQNDDEDSSSQPAAEPGFSDAQNAVVDPAWMRGSTSVDRFGNPVESAPLQSNAVEGRVGTSNEGDISPSDLAVESVPNAFENVRAKSPNAEALEQSQSVEDAIDALGDEEAYRRLAMAAQIERPTGTVKLDGLEMSVSEYSRRVYETLPDDVETLRAMQQEVSRALQQALIQAEVEGKDKSTVSLPINIQLFAVKAKLDYVLDAGENGTKARQFYEKRLRGTDANHSDELLEMLKDHSETYNPIANEKTLNTAKDKLRNAKYQHDLRRRIGRNNPKDVFSAVDAAAAQVMINDAINNGDMSLAMDMIIGLSRKGTELGRAVQVLSMQARLTPEGTLRTANKVLRKEADRIIGEGADAALDTLADDLVDAVEQAEANAKRREGEKTASVETTAEPGGVDETTLPPGTPPPGMGGMTQADPSGATREQLRDALVDDLADTPGNYLSKADIGKLVDRVIRESSHIPEQLRRYVNKKIGTGALAERIYEVYKKGHLNETTLRRAMESALGLPTLTEAEIARVVELATEISSLDEDPVKQAEVMDTLYDMLGEKLPVTFMESLQAWRKFAMLFNPKTHIRNIVSNEVYRGVRKVDNAITQALEHLLLKDPSKATAAMGWSHNEAGRALMPTLERAADEAMLELQHRGKKYETGSGVLSSHRKYFKWDRLNETSDFNSDLLEKVDLKMSRSAFIDALGQVMVARGLTEVTPEARNIAMTRAQEATFRADNAINDVIKAIKKFQRSDKMGLRLFGHAADVVIPFAKTPANIAVQSFYHSPLGLVKGAFDLYNATKGKGTKDAAQAINTIAKGLNGSALMGIGVLLGLLGIIRTGFGRTEKERAADELAGIQENSLLIGNVSISFDWLQPAASPFIVGASIAQRLREDDLSVGSVFGAVMDGTDSLFELTMLQSLYDVLGGYDAGASASAGSVLENVVSQSVPTVFGQAARALDPVQRKTKGDNDFETLVNQVISKIPGLTYLLEPELDVWGEEVYRTGKPGFGSALINVLQQFGIPSNIKIGTGADDEVSQEILRLYGDGLADGASSAIPSTFSWDDAQEHDWDYTEANRELGALNRYVVERFLNDQEPQQVQVKVNGRSRKVLKYYSEMTDEERRKVLTRLYTKSKKQMTDEESDDEYFDDIIKEMGSYE